MACPTLLCKHFGFTCISPLQYIFLCPLFKKTTHKSCTSVPARGPPVQGPAPSLFATSRSALASMRKCTTSSWFCHAAHRSAVSPRRRSREERRPGKVGRGRSSGIGAPGAELRRTDETPIKYELTKKTMSWHLSCSAHDPLRVAPRKSLPKPTNLPLRPRAKSILRAERRGAVLAHKMAHRRQVAAARRIEDVIPSAGRTAASGTPRGASPWCGGAAFCFGKRSGCSLPGCYRYYMFGRKAKKSKLLATSCDAAAGRISTP